MIVEFLKILRHLPLTSIMLEISERPACLTSEIDRDPVYTSVSGFTLNLTKFCVSKSFIEILKNFIEKLVYTFHVQFFNFSVKNFKASISRQGTAPSGRRAWSGRAGRAGLAGLSAFISAGDKSSAFC